MRIDGVDKYWIKTSIVADGRVVHTLAVMTSIKLHPQEDGYKPEAAEKLLGALRDAKEQNGFAAVEILQSGQ